MGCISDSDALPNSTCGVGRIELGEGLDILECLIVHAKSYCKPALGRMDLWLDIRCIRSVLVPVLEQVFDFRNQEATCIVELCSALVVQEISSRKKARLRPAPSFNADASSSSVVGRCLSRGVVIDDGRWKEACRQIKQHCCCLSKFQFSSTE